MRLAQLSLACLENKQPENQQLAMAGCSCGDLYPSRPGRTAPITWVPRFNTLRKRRVQLLTNSALYYILVRIYYYQ